ncbi:MAG TPA: DUF1616 domain-containing protein [Methanomicrobia archaeon]|nr:DUF1616 domain-containing protein [Methanomicrobia archaeon]
MAKLTRYHLFAALTCAYAAFLFYLSSRSTLPGLDEFAFLYGLVDYLKEVGLEVLMYPFYVAYLYPDKIAHVLLYLVFGLLLHLAFRTSRSVMVSTRPALFAVLAGLLFGVTDELHQFFVPGRSMSALDLGADLTGLLLAQVLIFFVGLLRFLKGEHLLPRVSCAACRAPRRTAEKPSALKRALIIAVICLILIVGGILIYAKVTIDDEPYTALYIMGAGGKADTYPKAVHLLEPSTISVVIENYERAPVTYTLQVLLDGYQLHEEQIRLSHGETWKDAVQFTPRHVSQHAKLEFLLFKDGSFTSPYRSVHFWVESVINPANLAALSGYALTELPVLANSDMELDSNWQFMRTGELFRGHYTKFYQMVEDATVSGYVLDNRTGVAIGNARIHVTNRYGIERTNITDETGFYEFQLMPDFYWRDITAREYQKLETAFELTADEPLVRNLGLEPIIAHNRTVAELSGINETIPVLPPELLPAAVSTVSGYVLYNATPLSGVTVVVSDRDQYDKSALTASTGYFELDVIPGRLWLDVLPAGYLATATEFSTGDGQRVTLEVALDAYPASTYQLDIPSGTAIATGALGGIYQEFESAEGLATLSFTVADSYRTTRSVGYLSMQAVVNDLVVWEDDVAGDDGWQDVRIPVMLDNGTNRVTLRVYAKQDATSFPLTVWWDSVRLEPLAVLLNEPETSFAIFDMNGTEQHYHPTRLHLGVPAAVLARIDNNEHRPMTYILQVRLDGAVLSSQEVFVEDGVRWEQPLAFVPDRLGALLKLEFLLFSDHVDEEPYKSFQLKVSSEVDHTNTGILSNYVVSPLPALLNAEFDTADGWRYSGTAADFAGGLTDAVYLSPWTSYELRYPGRTRLEAGASAGIYQDFTVTRYPATVVIACSVQDSYTSDRAGPFVKQVLLNDVVIWEDNVAGDAAWQQVKLPVTLRAKQNSLMLRVYAERSSSDFPITVWWDDVRIEPITALLEESLPASFAILDAAGREDTYPTALYLGEPMAFLARVEHHDRAEQEYLLQLRFEGRVLQTRSKWLKQGETWEQPLTFTSDRVGSTQQLEFLLFKSRVSEKPYRFIALSVSTALNLNTLEPLVRYGLEPLPVVDNGDMRSIGWWTFASRGHFDSALYAHENTSPPFSYGMTQRGRLTSGDYAALSQDVYVANDGVAVLSFTVRDTYETTSAEGKKLIKQVLVNDEVVWSDDVSGRDAGYTGWVVEEFVGPYWIWNEHIKTREAFNDWVQSRYDWWEAEWIKRTVPRVKSGWRLVEVPVYLTAGDTTVTLRVYAAESVEYLDVTVYWDDVAFTPIGDLVQVGDRTRLRRYR